MPKHFLNRVPVLGLLLVLLLVGCQVGEDDPVVSLRSRDARLKGKWEMTQLKTETTVYLFNQGSIPEENTLAVTYDGRNLRALATAADVQVLDTTIGFGFIMEIKDRGNLAYTATIVQNGLGLRSGGEDRWYWISDDRRKSRVFLGNLLQGTQVLAVVPGGAGNITDFEVKELRNDLLRLGFSRRSEEIGLDGNSQETITSGELAFRPN